MNPKRIAALPWSALKILSGDKSFVDNPLLGSRRLNRLGLHAWRVQAAHRATERRRAALASSVEADDRRSFEHDGFVLRRELLPRPAFERLRDAALAQAAPAREMLQGDTVTRRIAVDRLLLRAAPPLALLLEHPVWRGLTRYVAGYAAPPWAYLQTILTAPGAAAADPQTALHADTFHPTMKAWYFLEDVAFEDGPFCYVPGSHRATAARLAWEHARSLEAGANADRYSARGSFRISPAELPALDLPPPRAFAVPANTLVVADTFGFHARGRSERPSTRIEIWGYDRRNPFLPWTTDGLLAMAGQRDRRASLYWAALGAVERAGGRRNPWRDVGRQTPGAPALLSPAGRRALEPPVSPGADQPTTAPPPTR